MFLLVGLTGGIATGKSTVAEALRRLGAVVIDADQLARDVVAPGEPALAEIAREFGDVLRPDGSLDRKRLGAIVFGDTPRRKRLEAITHPAIRDRFLARLAALEAEGFAGLVFFDAPVMIESGNYRNMDRLVVVVTDEATQRARLMARDGMTAAEATRRMATQMPVADKAKLADYVIDNSGDRAATEARAAEVHHALAAESEVSRAAFAAAGGGRNIGPLAVVFPANMGNRGQNEHRPEQILRRLKDSAPAVHFVACHRRRSGNFIFLDGHAEARTAAVSAIEALTGLRSVTRSYPELWNVQHSVPRSASRTPRGSVVVPRDGGSWRVVAVFLRESVDTSAVIGERLSPQVHLLSWPSNRDVLCAYDRPGEPGDVGVVTRAVLRRLGSRAGLVASGRAVGVIMDILSGRGLAVVERQVPAPDGS